MQWGRWALVRMGADTAQLTSLDVACAQTSVSSRVVGTSRELSSGESDHFEHR